MEHLPTIIVWALGFCLFVITNKWFFGRNPFNIRGYAFILSTALLCIAATTPTASAQTQYYAQASITWSPFSILGQGGGPNIPLDGTTQNNGLCWCVSGTENVQGGPGGRWQYNTSEVVQLLQYPGYWQGTFWIDEVNLYNPPATGRTKRCIVRVIDGVNDRHVEIGIDNQTFVIHGNFGDSGASTSFDLEYPITDKSNPFTQNADSGLANGLWYTRTLSAFSDAAGGQVVQYGGVGVSLPSGAATQPATTQATSQPTDPSTDYFLDAATKGQKDSNHPDRSVFTWNQTGTSSQDGPQPGDMPVKTHLSAFIQPNSVLHRANNADAAAAFSALLEDLDPGLTDPHWNNDTWTKDLGIHDGLPSIIGEAFNGLKWIDDNAPHLATFGRMMGEFTIVIATIKYIISTIAWGIGLRNPSQLAPPVGTTE